MRLIDAEVVKEFFMENLILPHEGHKKIVETMIDAIPTAYGIDKVDKVIEKLEKIKYVVAEKNYLEAAECDYGQYNECEKALMIKDIEQILES